VVVQSEKEIEDFGPPALPPAGASGSKSKKAKAQQVSDYKGEV
jgi:hypothetical protein